MENACHLWPVFVVIVVFFFPDPSDLHSAATIESQHLPLQNQSAGDKRQDGDAKNKIATFFFILL